VLKVVGGASVSDLVIDAAERLPATAIPLIEATAAPADISLQVLSPPADTVPMANPMDALFATHSESSKPSLADDSSDEDLQARVHDLASPCTDYAISGYPEERKDPFDDVKPAEVVQRREVMSFGQARFWLMRHLVDDPNTFNCTGGMWLEGFIDVGRLGRAAEICAQRHEVFRTRFFEEPGRPDRPMQAIMSATRLRFEDRPVTDKSAALAGFQELERYLYDLDKGDVARIVHFHWSSTEHLLVIAYHHIIGDGTSYEILFNEIASIYAGQRLPAPPQYADYAIRQRRAYEDGEMSEDIAYWEAEFNTLPAVLPLLPLANISTRSKAVSWDYHSGFLRLPPMLAARIKGRSRKHKADAVHFYLAAFQVLLARLSGSSDIVIGVNDANRQTLQDLTTVGFFINLMPVRLAYSTNQTFSESINQARNKVREALLHSKVPFDVLLQHLNIPRASTHPPLFQAGFDYKQGQAEHGNIGAARMVGIQLSRSRTANDITLEVMDDPTRDPQIGIKLQTSLYAEEDVQPILQSYLNLLTTFSRNPALRAEEPRLFARSDVDHALQLGKGMPQSHINFVGDSLTFT